MAQKIWSKKGLDSIWVGVETLLETTENESIYIEMQLENLGYHSNRISVVVLTIFEKQKKDSWLLCN